MSPNRNETVQAVQARIRGFENLAKELDAKAKQDPKNAAKHEKEAKEAREQAAYLKRLI